MLNLGLSKVDYERMSVSDIFGVHQPASPLYNRGVDAKIRKEEFI